MLKDPRAESLASNFVFHWLNMRRLGEVDPDRAIFPYASGRGDPRGDYMTELELFAKSIFDENRSVAEFMTAKYTYLNERLALLYGINEREGRSLPARRARRIRRAGACSARARS